MGGIIGALMQSLSAFLLEGLRARRRERKELIALARNWEREGRPDQFRDAELKRADLSGAQLRGSDWSCATLQKANLSTANLREANMQGADLRMTNLRGANLQGANLRLVGLKGANLVGANLAGASMWDAKLDESTTLPDGTKWLPGTELTRFTDPDHPNFWRSDDPNSPAYRGKDGD
jgi:uncharacterized protein YjbI with pentapeptide repeats